MSNKTRTTFYIGVTADIEARVFQHKTGTGSIFTSKYKLTKLMHYVEYSFIVEAIAREKQLKRWHRQWKINLIRTSNPDMVDLAKDWYTKEEIEFHRRLHKKLREVIFRSSNSKIMSG